MKMKTSLIIIGIILMAAGVGLFFWITNSQNSISFISPLGKAIKQAVPQETPKPLEKYTFENLRNSDFEKNQIILEEVITEEDDFTSHLFSYTSEGKKITGQINIPDTEPPRGGFPIVLMLRGYINPETYQTGDGTKRAAAIFASNGFVTIAPDFLGHGGSDDPDVNTLAARVKRPYNILTLINSLDTLDDVSTKDIVIWGHSNGGQIALSLLEITQKEIPTTLWAPVSKSFPYSILYYTDEYDDQGKALRKVISNFENDYNVDNFSIHRYLEDIQAPIQLHQGTADDAVPKEWSDELVDKLEELEKDITYYVYPGANHNLVPAWDIVVQRDITFFENALK